MIVATWVLGYVGQCYGILIRLRTSMTTRDQSTPVALTFDCRSVVTRIILSIGATRALSPASRAAAHHRIHVGLTTPPESDYDMENSKSLTKGEATSTVYIGTLVVPHSSPQVLTGGSAWLR
jgi:hypothetical protein